MVVSDWGLPVPALDGEAVAGEECNGLAELSGGDQIGTAASDGGAGAVTDDGAGRGMERRSATVQASATEAGIGSQRLCFLAQEAGHGKPRIALSRHES